MGEERGWRGGIGRVGRGRLGGGNRVEGGKCSGDLIR